MVFSFLKSLKIGRRFQCGLFFLCSLLIPKKDKSIVGARKRAKESAQRRITHTSNKGKMCVQQKGKSG